MAAETRCASKAPASANPMFERLLSSPPTGELPDIWNSYDYIRIDIQSLSLDDIVKPVSIASPTLHLYLDK